MTRTTNTNTNAALPQKGNQMVAPLALASLIPATLTAYAVGGLVENFGAIVRVEAADDGIRGMLVRIVAGGGKGRRYYADPAKCRPVR